MHLLLRTLGVLWASPYTLFGLAVGMLGLCTGGRGRIRGRTIEFYGGAAASSSLPASFKGAGNAWRFSDDEPSIAR